MTDEKFNISHTKLSSFRRCLQQYHWKYIDGYYPPATPNQDRGTAGHRGLAEWYRSHDPEQALKKAWEFWSGMGYDQEHPEWIWLQEALIRYFDWSQANDKIEFMKEEMKFQIQLQIGLTTVTFTGYVDGVVKEDGRIWLLENKFYKKMDNSDQSLDIQSSLYLAACRIIELDATGVIYNKIRIGDSKIAKKEPVVRQRVYRNPKGLDRIMSELAIQTEAMLKYQEGGLPYRNPTSNCSWDCPFHSQCLDMNDDGIEPTEMLQKISQIRRQ